MSKKERQAKMSFSYDRLWEQKLSQVYHLLAPTNETVISSEDSVNELIKEDLVYENSSDIYEGILRSTKGE